MKFKLYLTLIFFFQILFTNAQCFECIKTQGTFFDDHILGLEKTSNGFVSSTTGNGRKMTYYDNNCNLIWEKNYNQDETFPYNDIKTDRENNIYTFEYNASTITPLKNITKYDQNGQQQWEIIFANGYNRSLPNFSNTYLLNFHVTSNKVYIIGYFTQGLIINEEVIYDFSDTDNHTNENYFISEFDLNGTYLSSKIISRTDGRYTQSIVDPDNNLYLLKFKYSNLEIEKYDPNINLIYRKVISRISADNNIYSTVPVKMYFSKLTNKILVLSYSSNSVSYIGDHLIDYSETNFSNRHLLFDINPTNGEVVNYKKLDFIPNSVYPVPTIDAIPHEYYFDYTESDQSAYILTRFDKDIHLNGEIIKPKRNLGLTSNDYNIILFKLNPSNLDLTFKLATNTGPPEESQRRDFGKFIRILDEENLIIAGTFESKNFILNNIPITNEYKYDLFIYKYNLNNQPNNIVLNFENTCLGNPTNFSIDGNFDSVVWNFGDGTTSTEIHPNHQYNNAGTYNVTALITCNNETREFTKEITITNTIVLSQVAPLEVCEEVSSTGIGKFNTLNIPSQLLENRSGIEFKFYTTQNIEIPNFISESYLNIQPYNERIIVKAYYNNNPNCISSTEIQLIVTAKTADPIIRESLVFCAPNLKQFNEIAIEGENLNFYNEFNQLINSSEIISSGLYYVTASEDDKCESNKVELNIQIQQTEAPIINSSQSFCADLNPTIANLNSNGFETKWYDSVNSTNPLNSDVLLINGKTYYASQIINNCESVNRSSVTVELLNHTIIDASAIEICKDENTVGEFNLTNKANELAQIYQVDSSQIIFFESLQDALQNLNPIGLNYRNTNQTNEIYATIISSDACKTFYKIPLIENINPTINLSDVYYKCKNENVTLQLDQNYDQIEWSNGSTHPITEFIEPGSYQVTVTKGSCSITKTFEVKNYPNLQFEYLYNGNTVTFQFLNDLNATISLDQENWSQQSFQLQPGQYTFYFKSSNDCIESHSIYLYKDIPTFISPNGDGVNEEWNISYVKDLKSVYIYDRFGKLIFHKTKNDQPIKWDGKFNGKILPTDSYWYTITLEDGNKFEGYIVLKNK